MQLRCGTLAALALATIVTSGIQATRSKLVVTVWFIYVYLLYGLLYGVCIYIIIYIIIYIYNYIYIIIYIYEYI